MHLSPLQQMNSTFTLWNNFASYLRKFASVTIYLDQMNQFFTGSIFSKFTSLQPNILCKRKSESSKIYDNIT